MGLLLTSFGNDTFQWMMSVFFVGLKYLFQAVLIDLWLFGNFITVSHYTSNRPNNTYRSVLVLLTGLLMANLAVGSLFYFTDTLYTLWIIFLAEGFIALVGAAIITAIIYTFETWFEFIA